MKTSRPKTKRTVPASWLLPDAPMPALAVPLHTARAKIMDFVRLLNRRDRLTFSVDEFDDDVDRERLRATERSLVRMDAELVEMGVV
jgi:hypothetical protein